MSDGLIDTVCGTICGAKDMPSLQVAWKGSQQNIKTFTPSVQEAVTALKDKRKKELSE